MPESSPGYYRFPTIHGDRIVFVCEDDLWTVPTGGGVARRLTSGRGEVSFPALSPDGERLAFTGREEGHTEVYVMPAEGGELRRLTWLGAWSLVAGWSRDGTSILFASNVRQPFREMLRLYEIPSRGGNPKLLPFGMARSVSFGPGKACVISRNAADPARWKRYRGGRTGDLWIDSEGTGRFRRLITLKGNLSNPMWIGNRIYFLSDHEGIGNLYSCSPEGKRLERHTHHERFYVRNPSTDGRRIVFHAGADLYVYDVKTGLERKVEVGLHSPRPQRSRKFVDPQQYLEDATLSQDGSHLLVTARGRIFSMPDWEGPVIQHGKPEGSRYRLARRLPDGKRFVALCDEGGEEFLSIFHMNGTAPQRLKGLPIGRPVDLAVSPAGEKLALCNHRNEILEIDLKRRSVRHVDRSRYGRIAGMDWSPDGIWLAYGFPESPHLTGIRLWNSKRNKVYPATRPVLHDIQPAFDPDGKYLYFLSRREFDPVYDNLQFELSFPRGMRPYLLTLRRDLVSPFTGPPVRPDGARSDEKRPAKAKPLRIDLGGIGDRVVAFPMPEGRYEQIRAARGKVLMSVLPVEGSLGRRWSVLERPAKAVLHAYDLAERRSQVLYSGITGFDLSGDRKWMLLRIGNRLRVLPTAQRPDPKTTHEGPSRRTGWIDLRRIKLGVEPPHEWKQMLREAWRLQRDHFWNERMSSVNWKEVLRRYLPLVDRVASRAELSDLLWEMQGELGTSHCYEIGGDYRPAPAYPQGFLAAEFSWSPRKRGYRVIHLPRGDPWQAGKAPPLRTPGANVKVGDVLLAIDARRLDRTTPPEKVLVNRAGADVTLRLSAGRKTREIVVRTLRDERPAWYRDWVESNRETVHARTDGRVGYVHIPNMGPEGYAEFHRSYLAEVDRDGLIVDVRFNSGGHVSQLLLEKLARKRVGYDFPRWQEPIPYPENSVAGPMVALTNEYTGSDGDIFSHCFKLLRLGPLVGKRTWGGVIGISPRHSLVDGSITTQPEYSFWFEDVGWGIENHGTEPDIEVDITPQDYARGRDPQLERAIQVILDLLRKKPPARPRRPKLPNLAPPRLRKG